MDMSKHYCGDDYDYFDYVLMKQAVEDNDLERYIQLRQLNLLQEIRDAIRETSED